MIGDKIEKNINKESKNKTQLIVSIVIIFVVIILFALFMRLDFSKPAPVEKTGLTSEERINLLEKSLEGAKITSSEERLELLEESRGGATMTPQERLNLLNN